MSFEHLPLEIQNMIISNVVDGVYNSINELKKNTTRAIALIDEEYVFYTPFGALLALNERGVCMTIKMPFISLHSKFGHNRQSIIDLIDLYRRRRIVTRNSLATTQFLKKWSSEMLST